MVKDVALSVPHFLDFGLCPTMERRPLSGPGVLGIDWCVIPLPNKAWVLVKGFNLRYHNKEAILFTIYRSLLWLTCTLNPKPFEEPL